MESSSQAPIKELQNLEETFHFPEEAMMVQIATARCSKGHDKLDLSKASLDWPYAGQAKHELRFKVFRDLWQRGFYLTTGSKFGGDYLVYPGIVDIEEITYASCKRHLNRHVNWNLGRVKEVVLKI